MLKQLIRRTAGAVGLHVTRKSSHPFGADKYADIAALCPDAKICFDVGANTGQTVDGLRQAFPDATIHSFEPVPVTFANLKAHTARYENVFCVPKALGDTEGKAQITAADNNGQNTIFIGAHPDRPTVTVDVTTADAYAKSQGVTKIDVLKIDTEGYEVPVLRGAKGLLDSGSVRFVLAECEFVLNPAEPHGNFFEIFKILEPLGYRVVAFYSGGVSGTKGWVWGDVLFMLPSDSVHVVCSPYVDVSSLAS